MLWGRSAGRCEFTGCNAELTRHAGTKEVVNLAEAAHVYGFSQDGPRHEKDLPSELLNDVENLMLVCRNCHKLIDSNLDRYSVDLLRGMKLAHERRVDLVASIDPSRKSHVVMYGARVGDNSSPLNFDGVAVAMFPDWYPAENTAIELGMANSSERDSEETYWGNQERHLRRLVENRVKAQVDAGVIKHLSVFAVAPQPLLILLGYLLSDLVPAEVYQLHREPPTWRWIDEIENGFDFVVERPALIRGPPALLLGTTDRIADERVTNVVPHASIWRITIDQPHNDFLRSARQLQMFRQVVRPLLDEIKNAHGMDEVIHVFPATAVAIAVELGRCVQPKVIPQMRVYDSSAQRGGFKPALEIGLRGL
jgi:hypothetical protein